MLTDEQMHWLETVDLICYLMDESDDIEMMMRAKAWLDKEEVEY